jgi:hypothetical protein
MGAPATEKEIYAKRRRGCENMQDQGSQLRASGAEEEGWLCDRAVVTAVGAGWEVANGKWEVANG